VNILQILPELKVGGVERGVVDLARYLLDRGHKAVIVSGGGSLVKELDMMGARHYELPVGKKNPFIMIKMIPALINIIKTENIDIVHARSRVPAWIAFVACRFSSVKFVTTAHGYYKNKFTSQVMAWARTVIVASNVIARHMIDDFGVPYERIKLIPRGVDLSQFKYRLREKKKGDDFVIGLISRITPIKGHAYFIKAISMVSRVIPKLKVLIVGDCPRSKAKYKEELEVLVRRLALTRTVEFVGQVDDIPGILSNMDLLVLPTISPEAFGRVIIEAQACGVPVIATKVGGVVDIIEDRVNGILVAPEDHLALQNAIIEVAKDSALAQNLVKNARNIVEKKFGLEKMADEILDVYNSIQKSLNILVIKIGALGDVVLSIPSLRAIRSKFPNADIKVLVGLQSRQILKDCPYINGIIVCDLKGKDKSWKNILKLSGKLRRSFFDMVIDLQNNKTSHILSFLSFAPHRYGYKNGKWSFLLNHTVNDSKLPMDPIAHQFRTLRKLGINTDDKRLELWPSKSDEEWADKFLEENWLDVASHILVGINPGGSTRWLTKRWGLDNFTKFCDELARKFSARIVLLGSKQDLSEAKAIRSAAKSKPVLSTGKTDLMKLTALIKKCSLIITSDSAPMHIAASMGVRFIALFGPTDPNRHIAPYDKATIIKKNIDCSPCYKPTCWKDLKCMRSISVNEVVEAVGKYLEKHAYSTDNNAS